MQKIIDYYPPVIQNIREIRQIADAEDKEFLKLNAAAGQVLRNMFVSTSDETGIARFEHMLGIIPESTQTLEERRAFVSSVMNCHKMTLSELAATLKNYSDTITLSCDYNTHELYVNIGGDVTGTGAIYKILDTVLPLQVYVIFSAAFISSLEFKHPDTCLEMRTTINFWGDVWYLDGSVKLDGSRKLCGGLWQQKAVLELITDIQLKFLSARTDMEYLFNLTTSMGKPPSIIELYTTINFWGDVWYLDGSVKLDGNRKLCGGLWQQKTILELTVISEIAETFDNINITAKRNAWRLDGTVKLDGSRKLNAAEWKEEL